MEKNYTLQNDLMIYNIPAELDHHVAREMRIEVDDILMKKQVDYIIFDFEYVNFMDSSGIGVIIGRYKKIASHGGRVSVINMNSRLKKLFNLSGMNKIINIYDTFEDAINS